MLRSVEVIGAGGRGNGGGSGKGGCGCGDGGCSGKGGGGGAGGAGGVAGCDGGRYRSRALNWSMASLWSADVAPHAMMVTKKMNAKTLEAPIPQIKIRLSFSLSSNPTTMKAHARTESTRQATHVPKRSAMCDDEGLRMSGTRAPQSSQSVPNSHTLYSAPSPPSSQTPSYWESVWFAHVFSQVMGGGVTGGSGGGAGRGGGGRS